MDEVRTERLVGSRPLLRDADELYPMCADPRVAEWLWPGDLGGPRTLPQVRALLVHDAAHWKRHGWGPWVVRDATTLTMVGRVGVSTTVVDGNEEVEVAWLITPDRWGEGLATEMAREAVRWAFAELRMLDLVSFTQPHNAASRAVMERLGFGYVRDIEHAGLPHVLYRMSR